jgi:hypothetical protein
MRLYIHGAAAETSADRQGMTAAKKISMKDAKDFTDLNISTCEIHEIRGVFIFSKKWTLSCFLL